MNAPNRSDSYLLPEGAQKVTYEKDTKISNAGKFTILREDHTIGNLIRMCDFVYLCIPINCFN